MQLGCFRAEPRLSVARVRFRCDLIMGCVLFVNGRYYPLAAFHCWKCLQEAYALPRSNI